MSDRYWASLTVWPFPETLDDELALGLEEAQLDPDAVRELLAGGGEQTPAGMILDSGEGQCRLTIDPDRGRVVEIEDYQASYGGAQIYNSALPEVLQARELAYVVVDDGYGEFAGEEISWRPGFSSQRQRSRLADGERALSQQEYAQLKARATSSHGLVDPLKLAELVVEHFEYDPHDWWPGKPAAADPFEPVVLKAEPRERASGLAG